MTEILNGTVRCNCNHLTEFAVLLKSRDLSTFRFYAEPLSKLSFIALAQLVCVLSTVPVVLFLLLLFFIISWIQVLHVNVKGTTSEMKFKKIKFALIVLDLVFVFGTLAVMISSSYVSSVSDSEMKTYMTFI
jgi:SNF family Na+-dependent transporter